MANTQAVPTSYKVELKNGHHAFGVSVIRAATTADSFKAALYLATATINATTTVYTTTGEVTGTGYTAGGIAVTNATVPTSTGTTAFWGPSANLSFGTITTGSMDCCLMYNSTQGNKAVSVNTFGATTVTAAPFTLTVPVNDATTGFLRLA